MAQSDPAWIEERQLLARQLMGFSIFLKSLSERLGAGMQLPDMEKLNTMVALKEGLDLLLKIAASPWLT